MKPLLVSAVALPLALAAWAVPASAGSRTDESTSQRMAATRSMDGVPMDATNRRTHCHSFGPSTHYRCTSTWDD
jgi:hypothetical protein